MKAELLKEVKQRLESAGHGQKGAIVAEATQTLAISKDTLYRELGKIGWQAGRKRRTDAGTTALADETIATAAGLIATGARANGKQIMDTTTVNSILSANGHKTLSVSSLRRVLRENQMTAKHLNQAKTAQALRSLHPNHVHLLDPSLCILYYPPGKKGKRQKFADVDEFYKNKPGNLERVKNLRVWRYVLVDHYSGLIKVRYFEAAGESQLLNFEFLLWCWREVGLPQILYTDKGSANSGKGISHFTQALKVDVITHEPGNARAKGAVENANNLVEKLFESRILLEPVGSVDELNQAVEHWQDAYNADQIPGYNARHNRHKQSRLSIWQRIMLAENQNKFRRLPAEDACRFLLRHEQMTRTVKADGSIGVVHPLVGRSLDYDISDLNGVYVGNKVEVSPLLVDQNALVLVGVKQPEGLIWHEVAPVELDDAGFRADAAVIGEEMKSKKDSVTDTNAKEADRTAYPGLSDEEIKKAKKKKATPFNGEINAISHLADIDVPAAVKPMGETVELTDDQAPQKPAESDVPTIDNRTLRRRVADALYRPLEKPESQYLKSLGEVPENEVAAITARVAEGISAPVIQLRNVNEG